MVVRKARLEDAEGISRVHIASWQFAYADIIDAELLASLDLSSKIKAWKAMLSNDDWPVYVAVDEQGVVEGFVHICAYRGDDLITQNIGEVTAIYINPNVMGTGVGAFLFKEGLRHLKKSGYESVALWVLEKNKLGINFYNKFGFKPDGTSKIDATTQLVEIRYVSKLPST